MEPMMFAQHTKAELTVFAAASLKDAFKAISKNFQSGNPTVTITFNFAGSQQLVQQLSQGASADIFASAGTKHMQVAVKTERIDRSSVRIFSRNRLVVIVPKENKAGVKSLQDIGTLDLKIVLADKAVPVGQYALEFLDKCVHDISFGSTFKDNVLHNVVSYEENVRAVLSKVMLDECDAGVVYASDLVNDSTKRVGRIEIPDNCNVIADYPIAVVNDSKLKNIAEEFVQSILSDEGQAVLGRYGFMPVSVKSSKR